MPIISPNSDPLHEAIAQTRVLLCEGFDPGLVAESAWVRQGNKAWKAFGSCASLAALCESEQGLQVVDTLDKLDLLVESEGKTLVKDGTWIVEGPAQRSDVRNKNGRSYPRAIWEKWIQDVKSPLQETIKARGALGHLEHPKDGRTDGNFGALLITEAVLKKDGVVWAKAEVLDTPSGLIVQEYLRKRVRIGWSSRGAGTVDESGVVSEKDYVPETWDAVMRPSTPGAYPTVEAKKPAPATKAVSETTTGGSGSPGSSMTDVQKVYADQLSAINRMVDTLDECVDTASAAEQVGTDIAEALTNGSLDLASGLPLILESVKVLREAFDALAAIKVIEQADGGEQENNEAFNTVVATLKKQVKESISEIAALNAKVEQAEDRVEKFAQARVTAVDALDEKTSLVEDLQNRLNAACTTISDLSESTVVSPVLEAVDVLVTKYPSLKANENSLRALGDIQAVVESVVPILLRESRKLDSQAPVKPIVPVGLILESETVPKMKSSNATAVPHAFSAQVGLAAAVVRQTALRQ